MIIGLDTNILCYALDPAFAEHKKTKSVVMKIIRSKDKIAMNPTIVHETYHTLVYKQKWLPDDARTKLLAFLKHSQVTFQAQTKKISLLGLKVAVNFSIGGRDSLILANLLGNRVERIYTHDDELLQLGQISVDGQSLLIEDPISRKPKRQ